MSLLDKPVSMNEIGKAVVQDFGAVSQNKLSQEQSDLSTVWESMYEKGLRRKVSTQCYFNPDELEIPEHHKTASPETKTEGVNLRTDTKIAPKTQQQVEKQQVEKQQVEKQQAGNVEGKSKRDLASVHLDRALNTSRANWHSDHGREFRRRRTTSKEDASIKIPEH